MKKLVGLFLPISMAFSLWVTGNLFFASAPARGDELFSAFSACFADWNKEYVQGYCELQSYAHCGQASSDLDVIQNSKCGYIFSMSSKCYDKKPDYNVVQKTYTANCVPTAGGACTIDHAGQTIGWQLKNTTSTTGYTCSGANGGGDTSLPKYCPTCP